MASNTVYLSPEINGVDTGAAGWYKMDKHGGALALRVASSNIGLVGEIRFNKDLGIFQGYDGNVWVNFRDNLVLNEQLQIPQQIAAINISVKEYGTKVRLLENLMIDAGAARDRLNRVAADYQAKLDENNPAIRKNYRYVGSIVVGQAVVMVGAGDSTGNLAVTGFTYTGKTLNIINDKTNVIGIVESVMDDGTCNVIVRGPVLALMPIQSAQTEFQKSSDLKNGQLAILDSTGRTYTPARKPLSDFVQIGYLLEDSTYGTTEKMVRIWVEPKLHIL